MKDGDGYHGAPISHAYDSIVTRPLIFWVEDNQHDVELMRTAFTIAGADAEFIVAEHGLTAFRYLDGIDPYLETRRPPDLVILDLNLPALNGQVLLAAVRRTAGFAKVPVVIFSTSTDQAELAACRRSGATECIAKPNRFGGYVEVVERLRSYLPGGAVATKTPDAP